MLLSMCLFSFPLASPFPSPRQLSPSFSRSKTRFPASLPDSSNKPVLSLFLYMEHPQSAYTQLSHTHTHTSSRRSLASKISGTTGRDESFWRLLLVWQTQLILPRLSVDTLSLYNGSLSAQVKRSRVSH